MSNNEEEVQRTEEWFANRSGLATASRYSDLLTEPRSKADKDAGELSATALSYALDIVAEKLTGVRKEISGAALDHGNHYEPLALEEYQARTGRGVMACGFVRHQTIATGASPDGLVGLSGGVEVKCPFNSSIHIKNAYTKTVPKEYMAQVQGQMWCLGLEWVDFVSFDPRIESEARLSIVRVERDEAMIKTLESKVLRFNEKVEEIYQQLT